MLTVGADWRQHWDEQICGARTPAPSRRFLYLLEDLDVYSQLRNLPTTVSSASTVRNTSLPCLLNVA
jgi:hypothetical protein